MSNRKYKVIDKPTSPIEVRIDGLQPLYVQAYDTVKAVYRGEGVTDVYLNNIKIAWEDGGWIRDPDISWGFDDPIENIPDTPYEVSDLGELNKCTCDLLVIMSQGCQCGGK